MKVERRVPYDPTRASLYHPGEARDFFTRPGPLGRAALCAELSRLAYCDDSARRRESLARAGLHERAFLVRDGTEVLIASAGPVTFVAFRGTDDPKALLQDLKATPRAWKNGGLVHTGFVEHLDPVLTAVGELGAETPELVFTGHSLGGAVATLATSLWPRASLFTFGSPRVGDADFAAALRSSHVERFVDCCDLVCRMPPEALGYAHVGAQRYIDRHGRSRTDASEDEIKRDRRTATREYLTRYAPAFWRNVLTRRLADHSPVNYAAAVP